jgi:hypothetical protein
MAYPKRMCRNTVIILLRFGHISALPIVPRGPLARRSGLEVMLVAVPVAASRLPLSPQPLPLWSPLRGSRPGHFQACLQNASVARHITEAETGDGVSPSLGGSPGCPRAGPPLTLGAHRAHGSAKAHWAPEGARWVRWGSSLALVGGPRHARGRRGRKGVGRTGLTQSVMAFCGRAAGAVTTLLWPPPSITKHCR